MTSFNSNYLHEGPPPSHTGVGGGPQHMDVEGHNAVWGRPQKEGMLGPQVRLVLLIQALGLKGPQHTRTRRKGSLGAAAPAEGTPAPPGTQSGLSRTLGSYRRGTRGRKGHPTLVPGADGGQPLRCQALWEEPRCPPLVSSSSPRYRKGNGWLRDQQHLPTIVRLLSELPRP